MKKIIILGLIAILLISGIAYLIGAFMYLSFDISKWTLDARGSMAQIVILCWMVVLVLCFIQFYISEPDETQKEREKCIKKLEEKVSELNNELNYEKHI